MFAQLDSKVMEAFAFAIALLLLGSFYKLVLIEANTSPLAASLSTAHLIEVGKAIYADVP